MTARAYPVQSEPESMSQRDWDKVRRQNAVALNGAERSEFPDLTEQIATAKGRSKVHGPWMKACARCGRYYPEDDYEGHSSVCQPLPKSRKVPCPICRDSVDETQLRIHLRHYHSAPLQPRPRPRVSGGKIECRYCGKKVKVAKLHKHNKTCPKRKVGNAGATKA